MDVGQNLFTKPLKPDPEPVVQSHSVKLEDTDFDYDIEYSTDHVPLGEILDRLQNEERFPGETEKSNLIRSGRILCKHIKSSGKKDVLSLEKGYSPKYLLKRQTNAFDKLFSYKFLY